MTNLKRILIIEDDADFWGPLKRNIDKYIPNIETVVVENPLEAEKKFKLLNFDAITLDLSSDKTKQGAKNGINYFYQLKKKFPSIPILVITAFGGVSDAVELTQAGACHYFSKPIDNFQAIINKIQNALKNETPELVVESPQMKEIMEIVRTSALTDASILITGESGTGKEIIANTIHRLSKQNSQRFVAINCVTLPTNLIESELFGHEKGAFTGASEMKNGYFEIASNGTIFLDEIGEMKPDMQAKLLRVIQERRYFRVGGTTELPTNARIIAATNKNIEKAVIEGLFRDDLFYRLNVIGIKIPPLRERVADIEKLLKVNLNKYSNEYSKHGLTFDNKAWNYLCNYQYPGNARQLENIIQRVVILCQSNTISISDLKFLEDNSSQSKSMESQSSKINEQVSQVNSDQINIPTNIIEPVLKAFRSNGNVNERPQRLLEIIEYFIIKYKDISILSGYLKTTRLEKLLKVGSSDTILRAVNASKGKIIFVKLQDGKVEKVNEPNKACFVFPTERIENS